ncbi:dicarboxylate/amino acid:cation symporter [Megasphaera sp.]|uniref:dicarboxylate/amino acid:cation symporter n=1 Tax=Megasphaera sp. TaxID=2023260 RepID=UPI0027B8B7EA|nr:dicarboxylate/amino acid:cation symporter [Megasphaera sp.]
MMIKLRANHTFTLLLLTGIGMGAVAGLYLGNDAVIFRPVGEVFINLLFTLVTPLVFFSISGAVSASSDLKRLGKLLSSTLVLFIATGIVAAVTTLILVTLINPCEGMELPTIIYNASDRLRADTSFSLGDYLVRTVSVHDFSQLLMQQNMVALIVFSVFFGICVPLIGDRASVVSQSLNDIAQVIYKMISVLMKFAPIGLGAYFANLIGTMGSSLVDAFARVMLFFFPVALAYFFLGFSFYCYLAGGSRCVRRFFQYVLTPAMMALCTSSSNAAIPAQREFCDKMGVPSDISGIVLPMGATMHMDGGCIATVTKIYLICILFHIPWNTVSIFALAIFLAVLSATAISSVPGGGAIGSAMIVSMLGLPPEAMGILILVGTLVDPLGTMINSTGDSVVSFLIARILEGSNWMTRHI